MQFAFGKTMSRAFFALSQVQACLECVASGTALCPVHNAIGMQRRATAGIHVLLHPMLLYWDLWA